MECLKPNFIYWDKIFKQYRFLTNSRASKLDTFNKIKIPCGKCKACLENQKKLFFDKNLLELQTAKTAYFITLTYEINPISTSILDLKNFIIKLKKYFYNNYKLKNIHYFGATEYGDKTNRPHAHILIYNIPITETDYKLFNIKPKLKYITTKKLNEDYFSEKVIRNLWGKGNITISPINESRILYITNYISKSFNKLDKKEKNKIKKLGFEPPKRIASQKLGIDYIQLNKNIFLKNNKIFINGKQINANKYIDEKLKIDTNTRKEKRLYTIQNNYIYKRSLTGKENNSIKINNNKGTL